MKHEACRTLNAVEKGSSSIVLREQDSQRTHMRDVTMCTWKLLSVCFHISWSINAIMTVLISVSRTPFIFSINHPKIHLENNVFSICKA